LLRLGKLLLTRKDWIEIEMLTEFKRASLLRNQKFCETGLVASFFHFFLLSVASVIEYPTSFAANLIKLFFSSSFALKLNELF
jgi:hypothetical protein